MGLRPPTLETNMKQSLQAVKWHKHYNICNYKNTCIVQNLQLIYNSVMALDIKSLYYILNCKCEMENRRERDTQYTNNDLVGVNKNTLSPSARW